MNDRFAFNRRTVLTLCGAAGASLLVDRAMATPLAQALGSVGTSVPACVLTPAQTEGPYFVDERLERADLRSDPATGRVAAGVPLQLTLQVSRLAGGGCHPLVGAQVDLWHCDADGVYSDANDPGFNTRGTRFLRGFQRSGADGRVRFLTIYPGWYDGRTVHIHFKIRPREGGEFTSQLYFDDALTDRVHALAPYVRRGQRTMRNADDGIFRRGGERLLLDVRSTPNGFSTFYEVGLKAT
ncbi:intradiol ring-cleavage dioxygenase [Crenobacter sp. SG2303]|uniref:Intradiol ring-cleavage dioxygenase n=1 Tax=Crenobacter oryzisoli TaxID=3056844 RepID=A0ABT7XJZ6_9NEIS|nr:intradiol ring-cleavage dioxygenase [Crenobacter sp. SG2303]MDN0074118.1 intradiol ring-cleavage dioxygenase [Crenobacter sp. SG2303]